MSSVALGGMRKVADFEPVRLLGEGAQGSVQLAVAPARLGLGPAAEVAVKVLARPVQGPEFERATAELGAVAGARCEYLVPLYEAGLQRDGALYYAMEYAAAGPVAAEAGLDPAVALTAVARAARGAHALHEAGVAHRRIKPSNLLGFEAGAKLSDLDLGHVLTPGQTFGTRIPIPDLQFIDPALLRGEEAGRQSDVWSLGVTLQVLLGGRPIYPIAPDADLMTAFRTIMGTPPEVDRSLDPEVAELVAACLGDAASRPATALQLATRIEALLG